MNIDGVGAFAERHGRSTRSPASSSVEVNTEGSGFEKETDGGFRDSSVRDGNRKALSSIVTGKCSKI